MQRHAISLEGKLYQQADLRNSIYNEVNADLSRRCESSLDLAALVALHSVTLLFERASHRDHVEGHKKRQKCYERIL